jgi:hypothetical protein
MRAFLPSRTGGCGLGFDVVLPSIVVTLVEINVL